MAVIKNADTVEDLKRKMAECEEAYHKSFKLDSCRAIMETYYEWQDAKKKYYTAIGVCRPVNTDPMSEIPDNEENVGDFNSLV